MNGNPTPIELSLNQATTRPYPLVDTAQAASRAGVRHIGLWLDPVAELGVTRTRRLLADTGLGVSSMCRSGFVADQEGAGLDRALDDVRHALDLSAEVGSPFLTFIAGGLPAANRDIRRAEERVREALETLVPHAQAVGVRLALEPLHPLFVTGRSCVTSVGQALRVIEGLPVEAVGVLVDAYATFWDPDLAVSLAAAGPRIAGYQVNDFALPLPVPENMNGRLLPGDGEIDLVSLTQDVFAAGYRGPVEVEVFNDDLWRLPLETIIARTVESFSRAVAGSLHGSELQLA